MTVYALIRGGDRVPLHAELGCTIEAVVAEIETRLDRAVGWAAISGLCLPAADGWGDVKAMDVVGFEIGHENL